eukprot:jgi/Tetstr1/434313/TSEL_023419.t1
MTPRTPTCTAEHHAELVRFLSNLVKSSLMLRKIQRAATAATFRAGYHAMRALRDRFVGTRMDDIRAALDQLLQLNNMRQILRGLTLPTFDDVRVKLLEMPQDTDDIGPIAAFAAAGSSSAQGASTLAQTAAAMSAMQAQVAELTTKNADELHALIANGTGGRRSNGVRSGGEIKPFSGTCWYSKKVGHRNFECPGKKAGKKKVPPSEQADDGAQEFGSLSFHFACVALDAGAHLPAMPAEAWRPVEVTARGRSPVIPIALEGMLAFQAARLKQQSTSSKLRSRAHRMSHVSSRTRFGCICSKINKHSSRRSVVNVNCTGAASWTSLPRHLPSFCHAPTDDGIASVDDTASVTSLEPDPCDIDIGDIEDSNLDAIDQLSARMAFEAEIVALGEPDPLPSLHHVKADQELLSSRARPLHYLGLCSGGLFAVLRGLCEEGHTFSLITLVENDQRVSETAMHELWKLQAEFPNSLSKRAVKSAAFRVDCDITELTEDSFNHLPPMDIVVASPPCQPFSAAGKGLGMHDPRAQPFYASCQVIKDLHRRQPYRSWIIGNVAGAAWFPRLSEALGEPMLAHELGSSARRDTLIWTNAQSIECLRSHYHASMQRPREVGELLVKHGFSPAWTAPPHLRHNVFPKFVSRVGSWAYRMHGPTPGKGMLLHNGVPEEPNCAIKCVAMGHDPGAADLPGISHVLRHQIIGSSLACLFFCQSRSAAVACLRAYNTMMVNYGFRLAARRLDNDSAFRSAAFVAACDWLQIRRTYAEPYRQFQNGLSERAWRTLSLWSRCMLLHASLSNAYWEFAMTVALPTNMPMEWRLRVACNLARSDNEDDSDIESTEELTIEQTDVDCAFLYATLSEEMYMRQPHGFEQYGPSGERLVCRLQKAVYGLKQAPHNWHRLLHDFMSSQGFRHLKTDPGATIRTHQSKYIMELLDRFGMADCKPTAVPSTGNDPRESAPLEDPVTDRSVVGGLLYAAVFTRPDIAKYVGRLCRFMSAPTRAHMEDAQHVMCYMKGTHQRGLTFGGKPDLELRGFSGANYRTNYPKSEYIALCMTVQVAAFLRQMLMKLGFPQDGTATPIGEDNQACIKIATTDVTSARTKHLDIRLHFVRDTHRDRRVNIFYVPTADMLADMFTKPLSNPQFEKLCRLVMNLTEDADQNISEEGC